MLEKAIRSATAPINKAEPSPKAKTPRATKTRSRIAGATSAAAVGRQDDLHELVQQRAYELWEREGRPAGREHDHWLQAEREIASTRPQQAA
jgi:hypothetical protein